MKNVENAGRKLELCTKLLMMGKALVEEGTKLDDITIMHTGNQLVLLSGLVMNEEDMKMFSYLSSMFSAKKIMDDMMRSPSGEKFRDTMLEDAEPDSIESLIKKLLDQSKKRKSEEGDNSPE